MARTTHVKAGTRARTCAACHQQIAAGEPYKWFKLKLQRGGIKKSYHPTCEIPRSHRTSSSQLGTLWDALDAAEKEVQNAETAEAVAEALQSAAEGVREASEGYAESASNIEDGFGHSTYVSEELQSKADELESFADELESWEPSTEMPDEEDVILEVRDDVLEAMGPADWIYGPNTGEPEFKDEAAQAEYDRMLTEAVEERMEEVLQEIRDEASSQLADSPY